MRIDPHSSDAKIPARLPKFSRNILEANSGHFFYKVDFARNKKESENPYVVVFENLYRNP